MANLGKDYNHIILEESMQERDDRGRAPLRPLERAAVGGEIFATTHRI